MVTLNPNKRQLENLRAAFGEVKAENDSLLIEPRSRAFVHTKFYEEAQNAQRCLLIGNKGAGKTALLLGYQHEHHEKYLTQATIDIQADDFPLESLFTFFYTGALQRLTRDIPQVTRGSDLPDFVEPVRISAYAWYQSLTAAAILKTAGALLKDPKIRLTDIERRTLRNAQRAIGRFIGSNAVKVEGESGSEIVFALLVFSFQTIQEVIESAIGTHTGDFPTLLGKITRTILHKLNAELEKSISDAARIIKRTLEQDGRRVLVTLDRFDDFYDQFYRQNRRGEPADRRQFLSALLQGLIITTRKLRRDPLFDWLHMLFAIPMDKFLEFQLRERVAVEQTHALRLEWTPSELYEYVNRRIAHALDLSPDRAGRAWELLFPFEVANATVKEVKEPSFLYIVRHSLWRPREVQMYVSAIFRLMDENREVANEDLIRLAVQTESENIIRQEFIEEFRSEFPKMPVALRRLENLGLKTVMPYEVLYDKLAGITLHNDEESPLEVMLRFYHMGIIGIRQVLHSKRVYSDATITQQREEVAYRFCYNCKLDDLLAPGTTIVFHPMFFEYLNLKQEHGYVVNQLSWEMFNGTA